MLSLIASVFEAYTVALFLPEEPEKPGAEVSSCRLAFYFSLGEGVVPGTRIAAGQGLVGWIIANRKPLEVPQFNQQGGGLFYYQPGEEENVKAFMGAPLPAGGALCVDSRRQYSFTEKEYKILQMFAAIVGGTHALVNFDSRCEDIPLYFAQLQVLEDLRLGYRRWGEYIGGFLRSVAEATGFDYCALATVQVPGESYAISDENRPVLVHGGEPFFQSVNCGLAGWVLKNGQPVVQTGEEGRVPALFGTSENLPDFAAVACLPVIVNKSPRACVCLGHSRPRPVDRNMRGFLREAVGMLSVHLEILYLRDRLSSLLASARVYREGPRAHNPDTEPYEPVRTRRED